MGWLHFLLLLYLSGKVSALNECNSCECCKTNWCEFQNGNHGACLGGCIGGYFGANCRHACISNCLACENASSCRKCRSGFYGAYCDKCPDNCSACSSKSNCNKCRDGFYSGKKEDIVNNPIYSDCRYECHGNCESCTSYSNCTSCKNGFYNGYRYKISNYHYSDCPHPCNDMCKSCTSYDTCTECKDGKYNGDHNNCSEICPSACKACTSYNDCTKCETGKYGPSCQKDCGLGCKNHQCDKSTGACSCVSGFQGEFCINCREGYYNTFMNCTCRRDFCIDIKCTSCLNSTYYAFSAACCPCGSTCKYRKCQSSNKCTNGCIDGYHRDDCSGMCKYVDRYCLKCTVDFAYLSGECQECISGYYPHNTTKKCETCSEHCFNEVCNSVNGKCLDCKDGYWGDKCEDICDRSCLKCNQLNGECSVCRSGKYLKDCSKDCSTNCYATNGLIMCAVDDGACLTGCNTPTKYGSYCEINCSRGCISNTCNWKTGYCLNGCVDNFIGESCNKECSDNCNRDIIVERSCHDVNGDCIHGCKNGFHGNKCERKCSENCKYNTCDKATGKCFHGCKKGFSGSSCTETTYTEKTDDDESRSYGIGALIGVGIGAAIATLLAVGMIVVVKRYTRCRNQDEDTREPPNEMTSISGRNDMSSAGVIIMEDQESDAVYENVSEYEQLQENTKDTSTYSHLVTATRSS